MSSSQELKSSLRDRMRTVLKTLDDAQRREASRRVRGQLERQIFWQNADFIFFYAPLPNEIDIWPLLLDALGQGKIACLPRFDPSTEAYTAHRLVDPARDVVIGRFGVREPAETCAMLPLADLDLVLVPGLAFDSRGHRLGRGKGFYDRLLAEARGIRCGVAFDEQMVPEVPVETHDVTLDCVVTPSRWIHKA
ncbi:MAG TPA: 5-formyltetrahydrofolate cyclo-ligase [Verrucomicrobiae bacterium]|nr:5-formyltetrahydrofolate cyclo-ligase [Verrucomicrobiae bacterium]